VPAPVLGALRARSKGALGLRCAGQRHRSVNGAGRDFTVGGQYIFV
jgi:hypothetical protein